MHRIHLKRAKKPREFVEAAGLAHAIWREHYASIISSGQIEYMLEKYQSPSAIGQSLADGYEYYIARRFGVSVGYVGIQPNEPRGGMFLSKFYLLKEYRGKGFASDMLSQLCDMCRRQRLRYIWLTVNKNNPSVQAYEKMGFRTVREQVSDIGGGYVMDDYVMEKEVPTQKI